MKRKHEEDFHDKFSYEMYIDRVFKAAEPFAEEPNDFMNNFPCHSGITTKEKCVRCGRAIELWNAIKGID